MSASLEPTSSSFNTSRVGSGSALILKRPSELWTDEFKGRKAVTGKAEASFHNVELVDALEEAGVGATKVMVVTKFTAFIHY